MKKSKDQKKKSVSDVLKELGDFVNVSEETKAEYYDNLQELFVRIASVFGVSYEGKKVSEAVKSVIAEADVTDELYDQDNVSLLFLSNLLQGLAANLPDVNEELKNKLVQVDSSIAELRDVAKKIQSKPVTVVKETKVVEKLDTTLVIGLQKSVSDFKKEIQSYLTDKDINVFALSQRVTDLSEKIGLITDEFKKWKEKDKIVVSSRSGGATSFSQQLAITFYDEDTPLGAEGTVKRVKFVGDGVTVTRDTDMVTVAIPGSLGVVTADSVAYDNTASGLVATNVKAALDELKTDVDSKATPADITTAINSLIGAAPGTLDTLNELAAALGDDPNFATTIATTIANIQGLIDNLTSDNIASNSGVGGTTVTEDLDTLDGRVQTLEAAGAGYTVETITTSAGLSDTQGERIKLIDAGGGAVILTLPTAVGNTAKYTFKKIDSSSNTVMIDANGTETIDGDTTAIINYQNTAFTIISDNTNWQII